MKIALPPVQPHAEKAYLAWIGHTITCPTCRAGVACPTAVQYGRAWRAARR